jgi:hypothetical protein
MASAATALAVYSQRLLDLLRADSDQSLIDNAIDERERLIFALAEAVGNGVDIAASESEILLNLDGEILSLLKQRRDELTAELTRVQGCQAARQAYSTGQGSGPNYMDKAA